MFFDQTGKLQSLTPAQFELIAALARIKPSARVYRALRMVQLQGAKQIDAAKIAGVNPGTVSRACARFLDAWRRVVQARM